MLKKIWHTVRYSPSRILSQSLERRARIKLQKMPKLYAMLERYIEASKSTGCSWSDYLELYRYVRAYRPKEILECGTGVSTIVLAYALEENEKEGSPRGRITSMEELSEYFELAKRLFPKEYAHFVDFRLSPAVEDKYLFFAGMRYKDIPERAYDFVFVDGPDYMPHPPVQLFDLDYLYVLERSDIPVGAMVDTRTSSCFVFHTVLGDRFRYNYVKKIGYVLPSTKKDLRNTLRVVSSAMAKHAFKRTSFISYFR